MSHVRDQSLDPASHRGRVIGAAVPGALVERSTDGIAASQRLSYWREAVLRRMVPMAALAADRPFQGRVRRIIGQDAELIEHSSDAILATRTPAHCRIDGCDDISIDLMLNCASAQLAHGGDRRVRRGDLCVLDYAQPIQVVRSRHRAVGIILPRGRVQDLLGNDLSSLAGERLPARGIAALLQSHMRLAVDEAPQLSPAERAVTVAAAAEMALAALASLRGGSTDAEELGAGLYHAARRLIERDCANPDLTPDLVAHKLGCSRASLYRAFLRQGESVAAAIAATRLDCAWRMLVSSSHLGLLVSEIAFRSGFVDQSTFSRMFRRRYGTSPRQARDGARQA